MIIMKIINDIFKGIVVVALVLTALLGFTGCNDEPDKYESTGGSPTVLYVRMSDVATKDSLITGAYMGANICIVGNNLRSVHKLFFNDKEAILNTSFMTDHTLLVDVPSTLPDNPTDKMYLVNWDNDTIEYEFQVLVPSPVVSSISNEYAADGEIVTIKGDYLLSYDNYPLSINFTGNVPVTEFTNISKTSVSFKVPEGAKKGYVTAESKYGSGRSKFYFRDDRYVLFDWDEDGDAAIATGHGWRNGNVMNDFEGITPVDGNYLYFGGATLTDGGTWAEDNYSFNYWPEPDAGYPELNTLFPGSDVDKYNLKFEINIPSSAPWTNLGMQIIFTSNDEVTYSTASNAYIANDAVPRYIWEPWMSSGIYSTDGWETVTIPLSSLKTDRYGNSLSVRKYAEMTGLTFFIVYGTSMENDACSPNIGIDNIRIAPIE